MIARNLVSSDLKGDEEATQREGNRIESGDVQINTEANVLSPGDVQRQGNIVDRTLREGDRIESGNVQINANENSSGNLLSATGTFREGEVMPSNVQSTDGTFREGDIIVPGNLQINTGGNKFISPIETLAVREGEIVPSTNVIREGEIMPSTKVIKEGGFYPSINVGEDTNKDMNLIGIEIPERKIVDINTKFYNKPSKKALAFKAEILKANSGKPSKKSFSI